MLKAMRPSTRSSAMTHIARGLSIVELMVGGTIGLFILAGATMVATTQLADNRRMLLENQVNQDLRAALDIITRDLRRAGYWAQATSAVWASDTSTALANPYQKVTSTSSQIEYLRSQDERVRCSGKVLCDNGQVDNDERAGFRLSSSGNTIDMLVSVGNWQALTDASVMKITNFSIDLAGSQSVDVPCTADTCPAVGPNGCPLKLQVRNAVVTITAEAVHDPSVVRSAQSFVRLRNDVVEEVC